MAVVVAVVVVSWLARVATVALALSPTPPVGRYRYSLPDDLRQMTIEYLLHRWNQIKGNSKELVDAAVLLQQLPDPIRYEAVESMTVDALMKVPLFARVEDGFM